mmetsp:Transcript_4613/g.6556  ORF Transcript_4613/g.6556 Transcript_4613/m.6556 type:complete len:208 (+) Transcript_4613:99-722(+)
MPKPQQEQMMLKDYLMKNIATPHAHDVLLGRGGMTNKHCGNIHYRRLVANNKMLYSSQVSRNGKTVISRSIVCAIRHQFPPGRFLQKDANGLWYDVGNTKATIKTSQTLREAGNDGSHGVNKKKYHSKHTKPIAVVLSGDNSRSVEIAAAMLMLSDSNDHPASRLVSKMPLSPNDSNAMNPLFWPWLQNVNISKSSSSMEKIRSLES